METTIIYWGCIGIMENKMETTIIYWGYIGGYLGLILWQVLIASVVLGKIITTSLQRVLLQNVVLDWLYFPF